MCMHVCVSVCGFGYLIIYMLKHLVLNYSTENDIIIQCDKQPLCMLNEDNISA